MKTITIRDLRQRWPETARTLQIENEIVITRAGKPVAKLVRLSEAARKRPRWSAEEHAGWQKKVCGGKMSRSDAGLAQSRSERVLSGKTGPGK